MCRWVGARPRCWSRCPCSSPHLVGEPLHPDVYSAQFKALCRCAEVPAIGIHTVRHTVARIMHEAGVSPADAAAFLGHTLAVHLSVYVVLTPRGALAAGEALGRALGVALSGR